MILSKQKIQIPPTELSDSASSIFSMDIKSVAPTLCPSNEALVPSPVPSSSSASTFAALAES